jgi:hypothetical protein
MDVSDVIMVNQFLNQAERNSLTALYLELFKITTYLATELFLQIYCRQSRDSTDIVQRKKTRLKEENLRVHENIVFT